MAWIVGKKADESKVEVLIKTPNFSLGELQTVIPKNYGGVAGDYSYYEMQGTDEVRVRDGWEYILTWSANEITAIDFSPEESKRWVKFSIDKTEISDDGVETVQITLELWKADLSSIETGITSSASLPVLTPTGEKWTKAGVVNGVKVKNFKTTRAGLWLFPSKAKRFGNFRVFNQVILQVNETDIFG